MKVLTFAILMLCIQISAAIVNYAGGFQATITPQGQLFGQMQSQTGYSPGAGPVQNDNVQVSGMDFIWAIPRFVAMLALSLVAIPWLLSQFGVPLGLSVLVSIPMYMLYTIALIQFISNRNFEGMK